MKMDRVQEIIDESNIKLLVMFEWIEEGLLITDFFPEVELGEESFKSVEDAITKGFEFAEATKGKTCNFYLASYPSFKPYGTWKLDNR